MNEIAKPQGSSLALNDKELIKVLQSSLYPGAMEDSVKMVISYCVQAGLDPMQKPVHIVPMNVKHPQTGQYEWRDVIMPGIGMYRIQADRSGSYAGMSAPEFGSIITETFRDKNGNDVTVSFPEYCEIKVSKLVCDRIVEFTAREYWLENYATDSRSSTAPNAMWKKRPRGQLAKCAEAQALRKGWPEIGAAPTAEEMEGKEIDVTDRSVPAERVVESLPEYPAEKFESLFPEMEKCIVNGTDTAAGIIATLSKRYTPTPEQIAMVKRIKVGSHDISGESNEES